MPASKTSSSSDSRPDSRCSDLVGVTGFRSTITQEFLRLIPDADAVIAAPAAELPLDCGRYVFCAGYLYGAAPLDMPPEEVVRTLQINLLEVISACERILAVNDAARICVIGSESGIVGSYDSIYAASKAALHHFIQTRALRTPRQQLVGIAPTVIEDSGMTLRRKDHANLAIKRAANPKKRFLAAIEVARLVHYLLFVDEGYLSGVVIRMNGGAHTIRG